VIFSGNQPVPSGVVPEGTGAGVDLAAPDTELVRLVKAGEMGAFDRLVDRHWERVYGLARSIVGSHEDALEVAQDAFVRAFRAMHRFRGDCPVLNWLLRIAGNAARNQVRTRNRRRRFELVPLGTTEQGADGNPGWSVESRASDTAVGPDERASIRDDVQVLLRALDQLRPEAREVLYLRHVGGLSCEEIAGVQDCSLGTVKSRLHRAREQMLSLLGWDTET